MCSRVDSSVQNVSSTSYLNILHMILSTPTSSYSSTQYLLYTHIIVSVCYYICI